MIIQLIGNILNLLLNYITSTQSVCSFPFNEAGLLLKLWPVQLQKLSPLLVVILTTKVEQNQFDILIINIKSNIYFGFIIIINSKIQRTKFYSMDMKFREVYSKQHQPKRRVTAPETNLIQNSTDQGWDKYARKTANLGQQQQSQRNTKQKKTQRQNQLLKVNSTVKSTINRYYRSDGAAPKAQFKQYLSDINNVFFEERESLKSLHMYTTIKNISGIFFLFLLIMIIGLHFINQYEGDCPRNATCGVFVHCFEGFQYDQDQNKCKVSQIFYEKIESYCGDRINEAKLQWGERECNNDYLDYPKSIKLSELFQDITNTDMRIQIREKLEDFLENPENQKKLQFSYNSNTRQITPISKKYSFSCGLRFLFNSKNFKLGFPFSILLFLLITLAFLAIRRRIIAKKIYQQLRKKTFAEKDKLLNISFAKVDLQNQFGQIDQKMWELIDQYRSKDRDIGFLQDDFLYWKVL